MATATLEEAIGMRRGRRSSPTRSGMSRSVATPACRGGCEPDEFEELDDLDPDATVEFQALTFEARSCHRFALLLDIGRSRGPWWSMTCRGPTRWSGSGWPATASASGPGPTSSRRPPRRWGPHVVRLAFRYPCPYEVLREAVGG